MAKADQDWAGTPRRCKRDVREVLEAAACADEKHAEYWSGQATGKNADVPLLKKASQRWASFYRCRARALRAAVAKLQEVDRG